MNKMFYPAQELLEYSKKRQIS